MQIRSLAYQTDLCFPRLDGEVMDRGDYVVIRTPSNPTFHWGNFLLFDRPPASGDLDRWRRLFAEEIGAAPATQHLAFGWDSVEGETGDIQPFKTRQMARYRAMARAGLGEWFGVFSNRQVVADLGVFVGNGVGRFQSVGTHPDFRRRGFCGTLVYEAAQCALKQLGAKTLVMAADEEYHAAGIYESVGFRPTEHQIGMDWWEE